MSYAKRLYEKMREQLIKIWEKKHVSDFSTLSIDNMKTKKKRKSVLLV